MGLAATAAPGRTPSLEPLNRLVGDDLVRVNQRIVENMHSPVALIPQLAGHIVAAVVPHDGSKWADAVAANSVRSARSSARAIAVVLQSVSGGGSQSLHFSQSPEHDERGDRKDEQ